MVVSTQFITSIQRRIIRRKEEKQYQNLFRSQSVTSNMSALSQESPPNHNYLSFMSKQQEMSAHKQRPFDKPLSIRRTDED